MCCRWPITKRSLESGRDITRLRSASTVSTTPAPTAPTGPDRRGFRGSAAGNGLDLSVNGGLILAPGGDADLDGLSNGDEIGIYFTDPLDADTDDDGLNDGEEVALATDPNNPDHDGDTICDGSGTGGGSCTAGPDNCPFISNPSQTNSDALEAGDGKALPAWNPLGSREPRIEGARQSLLAAGHKTEVRAGTIGAVVRASGCAGPYGGRGARGHYEGRGAHI